MKDVEDLYDIFKRMPICWICLTILILEVPRWEDFWKWHKERAGRRTCLTLFLYFDVNQWFSFSYVYVCIFLHAILSVLAYFSGFSRTINILKGFVKCRWIYVYMSKLPIDWLQLIVRLKFRLDSNVKFVLSF